jgi:hypothetical protein
LFDRKVIFFQNIMHCIFVRIINRAAAAVNATAAGSATRQVSMQRYRTINVMDISSVLVPGRAESSLRRKVCAIQGGEPSVAG